MKNRLMAVFAATLVATALFGDEPVRKTIGKTIVIKDGKVISSSGDDLLLDGPLFGKRAYLGVSLVNISPELREHYGSSKESGVLIDSVADNSPADKAGLKVGDVVTSVDGKDVRWSGDLRRALAGKKEGDSVRIEVLRNRAKQTLVAAVTEREGPRYLMSRDPDLAVMGEKIGEMFNNPEWKARIHRFGDDCDGLQDRIKELETRLKELEKKLK